MNRQATHVIRQWLVGLAFVWAGLPLSAALAADVPVPWFQPLPITLSFNDSLDPADLSRFKEIPHLLLEIRTGKVNSLSPGWDVVFRDQFPHATKRIVIQPGLKEIIFQGIRKIHFEELLLELGSASELREEGNRLENWWGPLRKLILVPRSGGEELAARISTIKFNAVVFSYSEETCQGGSWRPWISESRHLKIVQLAATANPACVFALAALRPLVLEILTVKNRIQPELKEILKDLRGVTLNIRVDGRLTEDDVLSWFPLEGFSMQVELGDGGGITPGLPALLTRLQQISLRPVR